MKKLIRILLVGPLPPPVGGDTRHFTTLIEDLQSNEHFSVAVINTSRGIAHSRPIRNAITAMKITYGIFRRVLTVDLVSYQSSDRGIFMFGPIVVAICRLARRPIIIRVFGGSFGDFYGTRRRIARRLLSATVLSADVILLQTRRLVRQLEEHASGKVEWFSTYVRGTTKGGEAGRGLHRRIDECRRFVFLGHLWRTKGIEVMLEAAPLLPEGCQIDLFGPCDEYSADEIARRGKDRVRYCGMLTQIEVAEKLWEYDCLVLPTHHPGEGYPGVIAEAFVHGLPVITTKWLAIPEIVDDECGVLIDPQDALGFAHAVALLHCDRPRWLRLREGARRRAGLFDHARWSRRFEEICESLVTS